MARIVAKKVKNAVLYEDGTIRIDNVRASYPHLFVPQEGDNGDKSYSLTGILPNSTHKEARKLVLERIELTEKDNKVTGKIPKDKRFLKNGDDSGKDAYAGAWTLSAREKKRPSVRGKDKTPLSKDDADLIEGGVIVNMLIRPWFQDNKFGKRINANLIAVQLVKDDGVRFGEGRISEDDIDDSFDDVDDEDGGFDDDDDDNDGL